MKPVPVYVDHSVVGARHVPEGHVGLPPTGGREHRNHFSAPLTIFPLVVSYLFFITAHHREGTMLVLNILMTLLVLIVAAGAAAFLHRITEMRTSIRSVEWFESDLLGLSVEQRTDLAVDIETINNTRDRRLRRIACARLQEIHRHATWLTEHQEEAATDEFHEHQRRIRAAAASLTDEIQQGMVMT